MKKPIRYAFVVASVLFVTGLFINTATAQKSGSGSKPIPENIMKVAKKSCVNCHTKPGSFMALTLLNLSKWDKYTPEKQSAKANAMCYMVSKDKMPPKHFRKNNPDGVPTKEEIKTICDWAQSIQVTKK